MGEEIQETDSTSWETTPAISTAEGGGKSQKMSTDCRDCLLTVLNFTFNKVNMRNDKQLFMWGGGESTWKSRLIRVFSFYHLHQKFPMEDQVRLGQQTEKIPSCTEKVHRCLSSCPEDAFCASEAPRERLAIPLDL